MNGSNRGALRTASPYLLASTAVECGVPRRLQRQPAAHGALPCGAQVAHALGCGRQVVEVLERSAHVFHVPRGDAGRDEEPDLAPRTIEAQRGARAAHLFGLEVGKRL